MGIRVAPDGNDIVVWKFDEAASPFLNSSTTGFYTSGASQLSVTGTIRFQQPSPFAATGTNSAFQFLGIDSGSPRNVVSGATTVEPQPPVTFSGWYYIRSYTPNGFNPMYFSKQHTAGVWSGATFAQVEVQGRQYAGQSTAFDFFVVANSNTVDAIVPNDLTIPLFTWSHIGITYDGTTLNAYINGNLVGQATSTSPPSNINYGGHGPWFFGTVPAGSGDPQEPAFSLCDFRIANVVRPQSYFQNVYRLGATTSGFGAPFTTYYKLRAYDTACSTVTPVYWISTSVDYSDAPTAPCGSLATLGPIEVVETWSVLGA